MSGIVADYKAIVINRVRLRAGAEGTRPFEFFLPGLARVEEFPVIVTYFLVSSNDLHMRIELNGTTVSDRKHANGPERCIQELARGIEVPERKPNVMLFTVLRGEVLFSDVVLWFQRNASGGTDVIGEFDFPFPFDAEIGDRPQ